MRFRAVAASVVSALVLTLSGGSITPSSARDSDDPSARASTTARLYGPASEPRGASWRLWHARYLEWFQQIPTSRNPGVHPNSPRNCETRYGAVFMGPTGTGRGCVIDADRPVLLSFLGWSCSTAEGHGRSWRKLRRCVRDSFEAELTDVQVRLRLDGRLVRDPGRWTFGTTRRVARLPEDNVWGAPAGPTRFTGKGLLFMLRPFLPGQHVVRARLEEDGEVTVLRYRFTVARNA